MAVTLLTEWYGTAFRYNYPIIERQGGSTVNGGDVYKRQDKDRLP